LEACFCDRIPRINNRTELLILQHRREQFHRFNTARIVHQALCNSQLLAGHTNDLARRLRLQLKPRAGLLYPGPTATLMSDLPVNRWPDQLVVVDGTWHHAKTLIRDIPLLESLPRYGLAPAAPSRYRIRREPDANSLSTVEAAVAALRILEPETTGFEQLLCAFDTMVEAQLAHPGSANGSRFKQRSRGGVKNIPLALRGSLENIVVAYGEAAAGERGRKQDAGPPLTWVAQRLGDGATFSCTLIPPHPLSEEFLGHLALARSDFNTAISLAEARQRWTEFQLPGDLVTVLRPGTAQLFAHLAGARTHCLILKSVDVAPIPQDRILAGIHAPQSRFACMQSLGRSTRRLAETITLVRHLNALSEASAK
jgi:DTW domain-containing protein YfiP